MANGIFLWDHPVSPYSQKVRIALREKNIPFKLGTPSGVGSGNLASIDPKFSEANHRIEVPTLVDGDLKIFESTIILEYLEDKYPETPLMPTDPAARAKARMIEDVCDSQLEAINWGMGEIENFKRSEGERAAYLKRQAMHQVKQVHQWLTEKLGDEEWFGGDRFGLADICVWPMVNRSTSYGLEPEPGTGLHAWYERAKKRPSVRSVFEEFLAGTQGMGTKSADALQNGLIKREYRDHRLEWMIKSGGIDIVLEGLKKSNIRFTWPYPLDSGPE